MRRWSIKQGDIIKFGRATFRVKQLRLPDDPEEITCSPRVNYTTSQEEISCRFCMGEENSIENPMITPCKCSGSLKFIHIDCLRNWTRNKLSVR